MRRPELERSDQRGETARIVWEAETRWHVRRATGPRLVPGDNGEPIGQGGELWLPHSRVHCGAMYEHERWPFADALIDDLEPVHPNDLHHRNLHPAGAPTDSCIYGARCARSINF
jgi:hypothetical protein